MREPRVEAVESVVERVRASGLIDPHHAYVALVSGGRDSVCLLDVLATLADPQAITVLHVNYGLRGAHSDGDELHVRSLCGRYGARSVVQRAPAPAERGNLQAWARDFRYGAASELALRNGADIATGHTASDQVETVLYRLAASPGRRALLGMAPRDGRLIRPLLSVTREQTAAYCRARGLAWREDASNADPRFARGRVRHDLLEALRRVHPAAEANVARSTELLRDESVVLDALVSGTLAGRSAISIDELGRLDPALARLVVVRLAEAAAGDYLPGVAGRLAELTQIAHAGGSGELDVGAGVRAIVEYGALRFERGAPHVVPAAVALPVPGSVSFAGWILEARVEEADGEEALAHRRPDGSVAVLDADRLDLDALSVRGWRAGDTIRPVGLDGSKSLADLFTDRRLPRAQRASTPVLLSGGEVIWVASLATAARVRVQPDTRRVALVTAYCR